MADSTVETPHISETEQPKPSPKLETGTAAAQKRQSFISKIATGIFHRKQKESSIGQIVDKTTGETTNIKKGAELVPESARGEIVNRATGERVIVAKGMELVHDVPPTDKEVAAADLGHEVPNMYLGWKEELNDWLKSASLPGGPGLGKELLDDWSVIANRSVEEGGSPVAEEILSNAGEMLTERIKVGAK